MTHAAEQSAAAQDYFAHVTSLLDTAITAEKQHMAQAARIIADCFLDDGLLYVFGSGHSHIFAEEAFFRAGGSPRVCPILRPEHMLHVSADRSTRLERRHGLADGVLNGYDIDPQRDVLLVVSNSGANALPVEVAQRGKERGMPVLAITSVSYASTKAGQRELLHDVADIVVDNHCPPGDALVELDPSFPRMGPGSSVIGLALLNGILVDALALEWESGTRPDVLLSAGMPDAAERNRDLITRFRQRVPHL